MNKGFLVTDGAGNVIYVPLGSQAARDLSVDITAAFRNKDCVVIQNSIKTMQRQILNKYVSSKTDEEFTFEVMKWQSKD